MKNLVSLLGAAVGSVAALSFSGVASAAVLTPSSFTTGGPGGTGVGGVATAGSALNTGGTANNGVGFQNFFSADFVALGSTPTEAANGGALNNANSQATSPFTITPGTTALNISFQYAFAGTSGSFGADGFGINLFDSTGAFAADFGFGLTAPLSQGFRLTGTGTGTADVSALAPGAYRVALILIENSNGASFNSAAGFNNIDVTATSVPFEFSPLGLVALGGAYYFANKNKKAKSEIAA
jgi:hypothetical protein